MSPAENPFKLTFVREEENGIDAADPIIEEEEAPNTVRSTTAFKACGDLEVK